MTNRSIRTEKVSTTGIRKNPRKVFQGLYWRNQQLGQPARSALVVPERFKRALWAIVRNDSTRREQRFCTYEEHSAKPDLGGKPVSCLLLWRTFEGAERYNYGQLKGTGKLWPITQDAVMRELRGFQSAGIEWVILDKPPVDETDTTENRTAWARIGSLLAYLSHGGRIGRG